MTLFFLWVSSSMMVIGLPVAFWSGDEHRRIQMTAIWMTILGWVLAVWTMIIASFGVWL